MAPAYWLKGDAYCAEQAYRRLTALADPNEVSVYTPLDNVQDAIWALNSFPMFGAYRVVVLRDFTSFSEGERRAVTQYCQAPSETSVLVLYHTGWAPDEAVACDFARPDQKGCVRQLADYCRAEGIAAEGAALELLAEYCQQDMARAMAEMVKLRAYAAGGTLDAEAVRALVIPDSDYRIYAFTDQVARGSYVGAHRVLDSLSDGNDQASFLGLLINHYRRAFYGKISGLPPAELGKLLGNAKPYTITKAVQSVERYSVRSLLTLLQTLYRLEYGFKSGRIAAQDALDMAIAEAIERRNH